MGSFSELHIGDLEITSSKNRYEPHLLYLFQSSDKVVRETTVSETRFSDRFDQSNPDNSIVEFYYQCSISVTRDRLGLMGYTGEVAKAGFYRGLEGKIIQLKGYKERWGEDDASTQVTTTLSILESLTVEDWLSAFVEIQNEKYVPTTYHLLNNSNYSSILQYMLSEDYFGFPGYDVLMYLRLIVDLFPDTTNLLYNFTELANGGWVDEADDLISLLDGEVSATYSSSRRFIVMTEGSTDTWAIQRSLKLLYPHLYEYFRFLDFEGAKIGGGAGMLANTVKAFSGAGIINRIIALFDNDTAAEAAIKTLTTVHLPENIVIKKYPDLTLAENYPTIGPTGPANTNINGLACSIELYLGEDVLKDENGEMFPIQWRGYEASVKKYQGEIMNKADIQKRFNQKLDNCENDPSLIDSYNWSGVQLILNEILTAFQEADSRNILENDDLYEY